MTISPSVSTIVTLDDQDVDKSAFRTWGLALETLINALPGTIGDFTGPAASSDGEIVLFSGTGGKTGKRSNALTGLLKVAAGVAAIAAAGTDYLHPGTTSLITKGFTLSPANGGTISSGTVAPDPAQGNYQFYTNNGAHTFSAPSTDCAIEVQITNGASAGSITFSGFTVGAGTGDSLTTTNTNKFKVMLTRINGVSTYVIKALQ
jgi:hypothetical protein